MNRLRLLIIVVLATSMAVPGCKLGRSESLQPSSSAQPAENSPAAEGVTFASERVWSNGITDIPVIMYHDVVPKKEVWFDLTNAEFERQMEALAAVGASVVSLDDVVSHLRDGKKLPPKAIALTFDDGTLGNYENVLPVLRRYRFPATFFVHTAYVGKKTGKDHMTWDQLREIQAEGLVDIQPHTVTHPDDLRTMTDEQVRKELQDSKAVVEKELGNKVRYFAYPSGHGDERIARLVLEAGYIAAWNEIRAWNSAPADAMHLPRFAPKRFDEVIQRWRETAKEKPVAAELPASLAGTDWYASACLGDGPVLVRRGEFIQAPDRWQYSLIGRPLVIAGPGGGLLVRYQPWMGQEDGALGLLVEQPALAVVGTKWLVHNGKETGEMSNLRDARVLYIGEAGVVRVLSVTDREKLRDLKPQEAVLLD